MKKPLAYRLRPQDFDDIVGQDHLVGEQGVIRQMFEKQIPSSLILYGPPGTGKTSIAQVMGLKHGLNTYTFNASTDTKSELKTIISHAKHYRAFVIIDEIHRMKKDIQDFLLPHVEDGTITIVGLTTNNPYHSVNPAIRSRVHIYKLNDIDQADILCFLERILAKNKDCFTSRFHRDVLDYIALYSQNDLRSAINRLELLDNLYPNQEINLSLAEKVLHKPTLHLDKNEDNYYNILSAFQKSIRGSDVDASLHYLARLIAMEDLDSILRRMSVIAYEDIGLANPSVFSKMHAVVDTCRQLGFPEARIPLSAMTIDLALSPKSNAAVVSIDAAIKDLDAGHTPKIPNHLINVDNFESKDDYLYPHSYPDHWVNQEYLPTSLRHRQYYQASEVGNYEKALTHRYNEIRKRKKEGL